MAAGDVRTQDVTLLIGWVLRICLQELADGGDDFAKQMVCQGHPVDPFRAEAAALPKESRVGLIVQPCAWALALAMLDIVRRQQSGICRRFHDTSSIASLETRRVANEVEAQASTFVGVASQFLAARSSGILPPAGSDASAVLPPPLYGACEVCKTTSRIKCHHFSPTPHRSELCLCVHGACHHVCLDPRRDPTVQTLFQPSSRGADWRGRLSSTQTTPVSPNVTAVELLQLGATFLSSVGHAGVRDLLGLKRTAGSIDGRLPPPRCALLNSLNKQHAPSPASATEGGSAGALRSERCRGSVEGTPKPERRSKRRRATTVCTLTVGGRALCKHAIRAKEGWWGEYGGTEADKNDRAEKIALRILAGATWVNLHLFGGGGGDGVFEVREASGYGARWSADGSTFRGFLEPHMDDGHEKGWRH
ncbi:unnamed protein product [Scytosiphon promiscuus]